MRPDEHKRRKNAQYKKKHGFVPKEDTSEKKEKTKDKDKQAKDKPKTDGLVKKLGTKPDQQPQTPNSKPPKDEDSDSDEQAFRRRNLVSNWSRYDELPSDDDDDLPSQRGEDFNKLIASAGGSSAQFRFHDEESWESSADSSATTVGVLALNLEDLQQDLSCLPLHQRLGISKDLFSESQLNDMNEIAKANETLIDKTTEATKTSAIIKNKDTTADNSSIIENSAMSRKEQTYQPVSGHTGYLNSAEPNISLKNTNAESKFPDNSTCSADGSLSGKEKSPIEGLPSHTTKESVIQSGKKNILEDDTSCLEDDLDILLSLDKSSSGSKSTLPVKKPTTSCSPSLKENNIIENTPGTGKPSVKPSSSGKNNLEDWLDSMLDD